MSRPNTVVIATVLRNNGRKAVLKPHDDKDKIVNMYRGTESRREFLQMFPTGGEVELTRIDNVPSDVLAEVHKLAVEGGYHDLNHVEEMVKRSFN